MRNLGREEFFLPVGSAIALHQQREGREEILRAHARIDAELRHAAAGEDLPELPRRFVHAAGGAEELPAHEDGVADERDGHVVADHAGEVREDLVSPGRRSACTAWLSSAWTRPFLTSRNTASTASAPRSRICSRTGLPPEDAWQWVRKSDVPSRTTEAVTSGPPFSAARWAASARKPGRRRLRAPWPQPRERGRCCESEPSRSP